MVMESKDILIMNSTIIGGILILLTISSFSENEFPNRSIFVVIAVVVVIIFSISSISILFDKQEQIIKKYSKMGFIALIGFMIFIGITNIINIISPEIWKKYASLIKLLLAIQRLFRIAIQINFYRRYIVA